MVLSENQKINSVVILSETPRVTEIPFLLSSLFHFINDTLQIVARRFYLTILNNSLVQALSDRLTSCDMDKISMLLFYFMNDFLHGEALSII